MHLLRCLHFFLDISLVAKHIAGVNNTAADALSQDKLVSFFQCVPQANQLPIPVPLPLMDEIAQTTTMLSESTSTEEDCHSAPHRATAITTGTISLEAMG